MKNTSLVRGLALVVCSAAFRSHSSFDGDIVPHDLPSGLQILTRPCVSAFATSHLLVDIMSSSGLTLIVLTLECSIGPMVVFSCVENSFYLMRLKFQ